MRSGGGKAEIGRPREYLENWKMESISIEADAAAIRMPKTRKKGEGVKLRPR
jgi:hypothetical protein